MIDYDILSDDTDRPRRYTAAPGPTQPHRITDKGRRTRDDLHEWAMYRQNVTSDIVGIAQQDHMQRSQTGQPQTQRTQSPTYGDFQMHDRAVTSVLQRGRREGDALLDQDQGAGGDAYLRFGLPRVQLSPVPQQQQSNGHYIQQRNGQYTTTTTSPTPPRFGSQRHNHGADGGHYFSTADLRAHQPQQLAEYNYLRYARADELMPVTTDVAPVRRLCVEQLTFDHDARSAFDRWMLRSPGHERTLDCVSFSLSAGETLVVMYSDAFEANTLLSLVAGRCQSRGVVQGHFELNGVRIASSKGLRKRACLDLPRRQFCGSMTVYETLRFVAGMLSFQSKSRAHSLVSQLIQTLALTPFHSETVSSLSVAELGRLRLATQLLYDPEVLLLTADMTADLDLYDTAFILDYLRDWALKLNRIVLLASNLPTSELQAMFSHTLLLSTGRVMYFGKSSALGEYFDSVSYPCPPFKNICDYAVDLVTLENSSHEARLESTERLRYLSDAWRTRETVSQLQGSVVSPLTPHNAPGVSKASCLSITSWIYYRFWLSVLNSPFPYMCEFFLYPIMALVLSLVFLMTPSGTRPFSQEAADDRLGLWHSIAFICALPIGAVRISRLHNDRELLYPDTKQELYSPVLFLISRLLFDIPFAFTSQLCFALPLYFLTDLQRNKRSDVSTSLGTHIVTIAIYFTFVRLLAELFAYLCHRRSTALCAFGTCLTLLCIPAVGPLTTRHSLRLPPMLSSISAPAQFIYAMHYLEFSDAQTTVDPASLRFSPLSSPRLACKARLVDLGTIRTSLPCPLKDYSDVWRYANLTAVPLPERADTFLRETFGTFYAALLIPYGLMCAWILVLLLLVCVFVNCNRRPTSINLS